MKMYGLSVDQQFLNLKRLSSQLEMLVRQVAENPSQALLIEAELTAACAQDHLRDMTLWLRGKREAFARLGLTDDPPVSHARSPKMHA